MSTISFITFNKNTDIIRNGDIIITFKNGRKLRGYVENVSGNKVKMYYGPEYNLDEIQKYYPRNGVPFRSGTNALPVDML